MDVRIPPLEIRIMLEPSHLRSIMLVRRLAIHTEMRTVTVIRKTDLVLHIYAQLGVVSQHCVPGFKLDFFCNHDINE